MKVFVAGATGAIGSRLVPLLVSAGHEVVATTRKPEKAKALWAQGAAPVVLDGLDKDAVMQAVTDSRPEVVVHEMTAIAPMRSLKDFDRHLAPTNRLRTEGTQFLLDATRAAGARKFVAQSYSGWPNQRVGTRVKTEEDPLDPHPPKGMAQTLAAIRQLEDLVTNTTGIVGIVLRYGSFYGPGTSFSPGGEMVEMVRQRMLPVIGNGAGIWSFIHVDDAANATRLAIERGTAGIYNIVDNDPAPVSEWVPELAIALGAAPPRRLPAWLGRLAVGSAGMSIMTQVRGSSNAKAKRVLNWEPKYGSWREGFRRGMAPELPPLPGRSVSREGAGVPEAIDMEAIDMMEKR
jgi:nucleoside-diphosphate-sugar epimerase